MKIQYQIGCRESSTCQKVQKILKKNYKKEYKRGEDLIKACGRCRSLKDEK